MKKVLGWILMILCGYLCLTHIACIPVFLVISDIDWLSRIVGVLYGLIFALVFGWLTRLGNRLRTGKKRNAKKELPTKPVQKSPEPAQKIKYETVREPNSWGVPEPDAPASAYLDDVTFMKAMRHTVFPDGIWHQYDVLLDAMGYGWDMMKDWADYMATADLEQISQVEAGAMGYKKQDVTKSYTEHRGKCKETPELEQEQGMLSIAGNSKTLGGPMKIVWINQTQTLRLFAWEKDERKMRKYIETVIRRSFGTENAMKLKAHRIRKGSGSVCTCPGTEGPAREYSPEAESGYIFLHRCRPAEAGGAAEEGSAGKGRHRTGANCAAGHTGCRHGHLCGAL